jgi:hypothetical protein
MFRIDVIEYIIKVLDSAIELNKFSLDSCRFWSLYFIVAGPKLITNWTIGCVVDDDSSCPMM